MLQSLATAPAFAAAADAARRPERILTTPCGRTRAEILSLYRRGIYSRRQCNAMLDKLA